MLLYSDRTYMLFTTKLTPQAQRDGKKKLVDVIKIVSD